MKVCREINFSEAESVAIGYDGYVDDKAKQEEIAEAIKFQLGI